MNSAYDCTAFYCKEPFIITLPSPLYDLDNVERNIKHQIIIKLQHVKFQITGILGIYFSYFSEKTYVVGTH